MLAPIRRLWPQKNLFATTINPKSWVTCSRLTCWSLLEYKSDLLDFHLSASKWTTLADTRRVILVNLLGVWRYSSRQWESQDVPAPGRHIVSGWQKSYSVMRIELSEKNLLLFILETTGRFLGTMCTHMTLANHIRFGHINRRRAVWLWRVKISK